MTEAVFPTANKRKLYLTDPLAKYIIIFIIVALISHFYNADPLSDVLFSILIVITLSGFFIYQKYKNASGDSKREWTNILLTWATLLITIILVITSYQSTIATQKITDISEKTYRADHRPWIGLDTDIITRTYDKDGNPLNSTGTSIPSNNIWTLEIPFVITNHGTAPGKITRYTFDVNYNPLGYDENSLLFPDIHYDTDKDPTNDDIIIMPGQSIEIETLRLEKMPWHQFGFFDWISNEYGTQFYSDLNIYYSSTAETESDSNYFSSFSLVTHFDFIQSNPTLQNSIKDSSAK